MTVRLVSCPACDGEGRFLVVTHMSREDGMPDGYREVCEECWGTGGVPKNEGAAPERTAPNQYVIEKLAV